MTGNPDRPAASPEPWKRRIDLLVLAAVAAWTLGSQTLVGLRVWDFAIDNGHTLLAVQDQPVSLDRSDPRDLFVHRAGEVAPGIRRLPPGTIGPERPGRIIRLADKTSDNSRENVDEVLKTLSKTHRPLPQKIETKSMWVHFLQAP